MDHAGFEAQGRGLLCRRLIRNSRVRVGLDTPVRDQVGRVQVEADACRGHQVGDDLGDGGDGELIQRVHHPVVVLTWEEAPRVQRPLGVRRGVDARSSSLPVATSQCVKPAIRSWAWCLGLSSGVAAPGGRL